MSLLLIVAECRLQAHQHSGLIRVPHYDEAGVAVCLFLIGGAFPIIVLMISMRIVYYDTYESFLWPGHGKHHYDSLLVCSWQGQDVDLEH